MFLELIVQIHDMKDVHELTLILVQALNLYIKYRSGIDLDTVMLENVLGQSYLVLVLDVHELMLRLLVVRIYLQMTQYSKIRDPLVTDMGGHPLCQERIGMKEEPSLCDTVRLVVELVGHQLVEIFKFLLLKYLGMQPCNTVYRI